MNNLSTKDHGRVIEGLGLHLKRQEKGSREYEQTDDLILALRLFHGEEQSALDEALRLLRALDDALCSYLRDEDDDTEINGGDAVEWLGQFAQPLGEFLARHPLPTRKVTE